MDLGRKISQGFNKLGQKLKNTFTPALGNKIASGIINTASTISKGAGNVQNTLNQLANNEVIKKVDPLGITSGLSSTAGAVKNISNLAGLGTQLIQGTISGDKQNTGQIVGAIGNNINDLEKNATNVASTVGKVAPLFI